MYSYIQDDYGLKRISRRDSITFALNVIARFTGKNECIELSTYWCDETAFWWAVGVWRDSPESGPRLTWAM